MKITNTIKKGIAIGATALALLSTSYQAKAQETRAPIAVRTRADYTGDFSSENSANTFTETLAIAPSGSYDGRSAFGQFSDSIRLIKGQNETKDFYMFGARAEPQKFFKTDDFFVPKRMLLWGSVFDGVRNNRSFASETEFNNNSTKLVLRHEYQTGQDPLTHLGATLDQKIGQFTPGFGFDRINTPSGNTDQLFGNLIFEPTKTDFAALIYANQKFPTGRENNRFRFAFGHYGPKENWGHRSFIEYDYDNKGAESLTFHSVVAPFGPSTFSRVSQRLITGNTFADDDSFKLQGTPWALFTENFTAIDRIVGAEFGSPKGLGFRIDGAINRNNSGETGSLGGQALYVWRAGQSKMGQKEYGLMAGGTHKYSTTESQAVANLGVTLRPGKNLTFIGIMDIPITDGNIQKKPMAYLMTEWKF